MISLIIAGTVKLFLGILNHGRKVPRLAPSTNPLRLADANVPRSPRILEKIDERWRTEETKG
jgi:hypothetical protein